MDYFEYRQGALHCEAVAVSELAREYGTPLYVYSRATLERHWHAFDRALADHRHLVCYAVKANSNLAVLNLLARLGSGFDIVSEWVSSKTQWQQWMPWAVVLPKKEEKRHLKVVAAEI